MTTTRPQDTTRHENFTAGDPRWSGIGSYVGEYETVLRATRCPSRRAILGRTSCEPIEAAAIVKIMAGEYLTDPPTLAFDRECRRAHWNPSRNEIVLSATPLDRDVCPVRPGASRLTVGQVLHELAHAVHTEIGDREIPSHGNEYVEILDHLLAAFPVSVFDRRIPKPDWNKDPTLIFAPIPDDWTPEAAELRGSGDYSYTLETDTRPITVRGAGGPVTSRTHRFFHPDGGPPCMSVLGRIASTENRTVILRLLDKRLLQRLEQRFDGVLSSIGITRERFPKKVICSIKSRSRLLDHQRIHVRQHGGVQRIGIGSILNGPLSCIDRCDRGRMDLSLAAAAGSVTVTVVLPPNWLDLSWPIFVALFAGAWWWAGRSGRRWATATVAIVSVAAIVFVWVQLQQGITLEL